MPGRSWKRRRPGEKAPRNRAEDRRQGCARCASCQRDGRAPVGTVRDALQLPDMRRIELGYGMSVTGELAGTDSLGAYAFSAGGAPLLPPDAARPAPAGGGGMPAL